MYELQQLTPRMWRVRPRRTADSFFMPDPALSPWARERIAHSDFETLATLEEVSARTGVPFRSCLGGDGGDVTISWSLGADDRLYGAPDADAMSLDRRGDHVHLIPELHPRQHHRMVSEPCSLCHSRPHFHDELAIGFASNYGEVTIPVVYNTAGWAVFVSGLRHDAQLDLGARDEDVLEYRAPGGGAECFVIRGDDLHEQMRQFMRLTGTQPLPPTWALGYIQSRFGYESFTHVESMLDQAAAARLPIHAVVFDVQWLRAHVDLHWDPVHFPDPQQALARIAERGARRIVITEPGTAAVASNEAGGWERDAFARTRDGARFDSRQWYAERGIERYRPITPSAGALVNVFREDAADWWYDQHRELIKQGVDAWWLDLNEPEDVTPDVMFDRVDWPAPRERFDGEDARGVFAIAQQRMFARRDEDATTRRPFVLSRAASAGSQRYGASPWTGDVGATWDDLVIQPRLLLNAGLSGLPLAGSDIGGFNGDPGPELFVRWMQAGSVLPIMRAHGYMADREPWSQGSEALEAMRAAIVLRAQLLPTIASWTYEALVAGEPLARPMLLGPLGADEAVRAEHGGDSRWFDRDDQWYFGRLLAAPVLESGAATRSIELPHGTWVDVWSGQSYDGGRRIDVPVDLGSLPLLCRSSDVLIADPKPLARRAFSWPPSHMEAWAWGREASTLWYVDDGITREHEQGAYAMHDVRVHGDSVSVSRRGGSLTAPGIRVVAPHPGAL